MIFRLFKIGKQMWSTTNCVNFVRALHSLNCCSPEIIANQGLLQIFLVLFFSDMAVFPAFWGYNLVEGTYCLQRGVFILVATIDSLGVLFDHYFIIDSCGSSSLFLFHDFLWGANPGSFSWLCIFENSYIRDRKRFCVQNFTLFVR
jgi:hypothetical protein